MGKALVVFRIILITATASFMAFHTEKFISHIEPNIAFAWIAAGLIEGMLISLALMRTRIARILLIPLFLISVLAASMSFIAKNENLINSFIQKRQMVEQFKSDLLDTQKDFDRGARYTTRTLQRSRELKDQIEQALRNQEGDMALVNSCVFFILVLVLQGVSLYTAMTLKSLLSHCPVSSVSIESSAQFHDNKDETSNTLSENTPDKAEILKLKMQGLKPGEISKRVGLSRATIYRIIKKGGSDL